MLIEPGPNAVSNDEEEMPPGVLLRYRLRVMCGLLVLLVLVGVVLARGSGKLLLDRVMSSSMAPTLEVGDVVLSEANDAPERYDILVFYAPDRGEREEKLIKRLIGLPGDQILINHGILYINGQEEYSPVLGNRFWRDVKLTVPEGYYFFLGDNRENSEDSLTYGAVSMENVCGVAQAIVWPPGRIGAKFGIHTDDLYGPDAAEDAAGETAAAQTDE